VEDVLTVLLYLAPAMLAASRLVKRAQPYWSMFPESWRPWLPFVVIVLGQLPLAVQGQASWEAAIWAAIPPLAFALGVVAPGLPPKDASAKDDDDEAPPTQRPAGAILGAGIVLLLLLPGCSQALQIKDATKAVKITCEVCERAAPVCENLGLAEAIEDERVEKVADAAGKVCGVCRKLEPVCKVLQKSG